MLVEISSIFIIGYLIKKLKESNSDGDEYKNIDSEDNNEYINMSNDYLNINSKWSVNNYESVIEERAKRWFEKLEWEQKQNMEETNNDFRLGLMNNASLLNKENDLILNIPYLDRQEIPNINIERIILLLNQNASMIDNEINEPEITIVNRRTNKKNYKRNDKSKKPKPIPDYYE